MSDFLVTYDLLDARIDGLPNSASRIAEFLRKKGIQGKRYNPGECPIARYLGEGIRPKYKLLCSPMAVQVTSIEPGVNERMRLSFLPHVTMFINQFDAMQFTDLIERSDTDERL